MSSFKGKVIGNGKRNCSTSVWMQEFKQREHEAVPLQGFTLRNREPCDKRK